MKTLLVLFSFAASAVLAFAQGSSRNPDLSPLKIIQPEFVREFPDALARAYPNGGEARLLVTVDNEGHLQESLLVAYSARPFGDEALATLKDWKFVPAQWKKQPITACVEIVLHFEHRGSMVSMTAPEILMENTAPRTDASFGYRARNLRELDRVPAVVQSVSPTYPKQLADRGLKGSVTVDFYVDEQGIVRMPSVSQQSPTELADAAVRAIRQWKFEPPLRQGKPVLAHVQQTFNFNAVSAGGI